MDDHASSPTTPKRKPEEEATASDETEESDGSDPTESTGSAEKKVSDGSDPTEYIGLIDSDDESYLPQGVRKVDRKLWAKYFKQIRESDGFDIEDHPGSCIMAEFARLTQFKRCVALYEELVELSKMAICEYNTKHKKAYEFVDVEKVNSRACAGFLYYITFQVKNHEAAGAGDGDDDAPLEIFQAQVWSGITENQVILCRPIPNKLGENTN